MLTLKTAACCLLIVLTFLCGFVDSLESFPPDCNSFTEIECGYTKKWCEWNNNDSRCQLTTKVNVQAIFLDYYELASNPFWMIMIPCLYFILFLISKKIASNYVMKKYKISKIYYEKCVIYVFEIIGSIPILFKIFYPQFVYDPIFNPSKYEIDPLSLTPSMYSEIYGCIVFIGGGLTSMYIIEMTFSRNMRLSLSMHHCTTILAAIMICICLNQQLNVNLYRAGVSMTLYATTESHVFYQLLLYRINSYGFPIFHYLSSYAYLFTRVGTTIIFFICWCQWCISDGKTILTTNPFDIGWCYSLWFFLSPISCIILNYAQYSSVKALFYISNKVYLNRSMKEYYFCQSERILELHKIYTTIDDDLSVAEWQIEELKMFIDEYCPINLKNDTGNEVIQFLFDTLILLQSKIFFVNTGNIDNQNVTRVTNVTSTTNNNDKKSSKHTANMETSTTNNEKLGRWDCCNIGNIIASRTRSDDLKMRQRSNSESVDIDSPSNMNTSRSRAVSRSRSRRSTTSRPVGIKWETIYYLFEKELTYLSKSIDTEQIIRAKVYTLVSHALQTFRANKPQYQHYTFHIHLSPKERNYHQEKFVKMIEKLHDKAIENILFVTNRRRLSKQQSVINKLHKQKKSLRKDDKNKSTIGKFYKYFKKWFVKILRCSCVCKDNSKKEMKPRPHKGTAAGDKKERKKLLEEIEKIETSFYKQVSNSPTRQGSNNITTTPRATTTTSLAPLNSWKKDKKRSQSDGLIGRRQKRNKLKSRVNSNSNDINNSSKEIVSSGSTSIEINLNVLPTLNSVSRRLVSMSPDDMYNLSNSSPQNVNFIHVKSNELELEVDDVDAVDTVDPVDSNVTPLDTTTTSQLQQTPKKTETSEKKTEEKEEVPRTDNVGLSTTLEMPIIEDKWSDFQMNVNGNNNNNGVRDRRSSSIRMEDDVTQYFQRLTSQHIGSSEKIELQDMDDEKENSGLLITAIASPKIKQDDSDSSSDSTREHVSNADANNDR